MTLDDNRYLLRVWREEGETWQATLRDVNDGELRSFLGLDELIEYLESRRARETDATSDGYRQEGASSGRSETDA